MQSKTLPCTEDSVNVSFLLAAAFGLSLMAQRLHLYGFHGQFPNVFFAYTYICTLFKKIRISTSIII